MSGVSIIVPEATTNLVSNPSVETNTTGYTANGGSLAQVSTQQRRGVYSLEHTPDSGVNSGHYYTVTLGLGTQYTLSRDVLGADGIPYRMYAYDQTGTVILGTPVEFVGDGAWHRQEVTFVTGSNPTIRLYVEKNGSASVLPYYADGLQVEQKGYATTYCDGDQPGCIWLGTKHASTSRRDAQSRAGGRVIDLESYNISVAELHGFGQLPIQHHALIYAQQPGGVLQSIKQMPRTIQLTGYTDTDTEAGMYSALAQLEAALSSEAVATLQPVILRYSRNTKEIELACFYDAGLAGDWKEHLYTRFVLRLIAYDPYWYGVGNTAEVLNGYESLTMRSIARYEDGVWDEMGPIGASGAVQIAVITEGPDGCIYVGGSFSGLTGLPGADYIAKYDPFTGVWSTLGTGMNGVVQDILFAPDGTLYACGNFTDAGGTAASRIASWDGATWSALGTGLTGGQAFAMALNSAGLLYVGGAFTDAGGVGAVRIASWDGSTWAALSTGMTTNSVLDLVVTEDDILIAVGSFTVAGGVTVNRIGKWDGSAWTAFATGGANSSIEAIVIAPNGNYIVGGGFTTIGGISASRLASWNGATWSQLGDGLDDGVTDLKYDSDGILWINGPGLGDTPPAGVPLVKSLLRWDGYSFISPSIFIPLDPGVVCEGITRSGIVYLGFDTDGTGVIPGVTTLTNEGNAPAYPKFTIKRDGGTTATLVSIVNATTGDELFFNIDLLDGETITVDLSQPDKPITSDYRITRFAFLPGSQVARWRLLPGDNVLAVMVYPTGSPTITAAAQWREVFASAEGAL